MAIDRIGKKKFSVRGKVQAQENLKQLFLAGLGLADETDEKLRTMFQSLGSARIRHPRIRKAVGDIKKRVISRRKVLEKKFSEYFEKNESVKSPEVRKIASKAKRELKKT